MSIDDSIGDIFRGRTSRAEIENASRIAHSFDGFHFVSSCSLSVSLAGELEIRGQFWKVSTDETAEAAGTFFRTIGRKNDLIRVDHKNIRVEPDFREMDIALAHYTKAIRFYYKAGVSCVFMVADEDGPVVWPQLGWQIVSPRVMDRLVAIFKEELSRDGVNPREVSEKVYEYAPAVAGYEVRFDDGTEAYPGLRALRRLYEEVHEEIRMVAWLTQERPTQFFRGRDILL